MKTPPPRDLDRAGKVLWKAVVGQLEAAERPLQEVELRAVERFVRASRLADRAWEQLPDGLTALGANGQDIAHPLIRSALTAESHAARFADDLGLTLKLKRREGRPTGASSAPDRTATPARLKAVG